MKRTVLGGVICAALALTAAGAADVPLAGKGPLASAQSLIAAHPEKEDGIEFTVTPAVGAALTADIAPDYAVSSQGDNSTTYDFSLRRVVALNDKVHAIYNTSLYGVAELRVAEAAAAGQGDLVRSVAADGSVHFLHAGQEAASYSISKDALTKDQSAGLARFLRYNTLLPSSVIDEIAASLHLPQQISYVPAAGQPAVVLAFSGFSPVKAVYPLRKGETVVPLRPGATPADQTMAGLLPAMQGAVMGTAPGKRNLAAFRTAIDAAVKGHKPFQALVSELEMLLQFGNGAAACEANAKTACHSLKDLMAAAKSDPRINQLKATLNPKPSLLNKSIATLEAMKRSDLSNAYVLEEFLANDLAAAGQVDEALPHFAAAITGNPYIPAYYEHLGNALHRARRNELAWFCYDLGRQLPGAAAEFILTDAAEAKLARDHPQYF